MNRKKTALTPWDSAALLKTEEDVAAYLDAALEIAQSENDPAFLVKALGTAAKAHGMGDIASETGLGRESLYKALSGDGNPSFATVMKVMTALGMELHATASTH